uniref:G_PROTEIN_RECEP_F1_2 domain-containing protein n=1 Tax=Panagrellus redivivus TaxID=6233 RepID=A0A7E4VBB8_PANRE
MLFAIWYDNFVLLLYIVVVPVQFVYRYLFIVKNVSVTKAMHMLMLFIALGCCGLTAVASYLTIKDTQEYMEEFREILTSDPTYEDFTNIHMVITSIHNPWMILLVVIYFTLVTISTFLIIYTSHAVWKCTRNLVSKAAREAHAQVTRILILQVSTPVLLCFVPLIIYAVKVVFNLGPSIIPILIYPFISVVPIVNSILVICFMKSYREFFMSLFHSCFKLNFNGKTQVTVIQTTNLNKS